MHYHWFASTFKSQSCNRSASFSTIKEDLGSHKFREDLINIMVRKFIAGNGKNAKGLSKQQINNLIGGLLNEPTLKKMRTSGESDNAMNEWFYSLSV